MARHERAETTRPRDSARHKPRGESIVGVALSRTFNGTFSGSSAVGGGCLGGSSSARGSGSAPATPRARTGKQDVLERITARYAREVKDAEAKRLATFVPIDKREAVIPCDRSTSRNVKKDIDFALKKAGGEMLGWDQNLGQDSFQKQLQFLHNYAKTGSFVEQYGPEGHYHGEFLNSMRHGKGEHEFRGEVYDGEWKWDKRHGSGKMLFADGSQIRGNWQDGKPHGFGTMIDPHGATTYEGEFRDGKRHGLGRQIYESGDIYDGCWKEGYQHDRGVYYFTNGDKFYGMWSKGKYDGPGVFHYQNGSISRRVYSDGILMSVQDFDHASVRFGQNLHRDGMLRHTADRGFPREVFMLSSV